MKIDKKVILSLIALILAIILFIAFGGLFKFEKNKERQPLTVDDQLIDRLYSYLPTKNDYNMATMYGGYYISYNSLYYGVVEQMLIDYMIKYEPEKLVKATESDFTNAGISVTNDMQPLYKISREAIEDSLKKVFGDSRSLNIADTNIDFETSAKFINDYLYIYKHDKEFNDNYVIYKSKIKYSIQDDKTVKIYDYYLKCNKETKICYNDEKETLTNNFINYSENLDILKYKEHLQEYEHIFKSNGDYYYWVSSNKK